MKRKAILIQILVSYWWFVFLVESNPRESNRKSIHPSSSSGILGKSNTWSNSNKRADIYTSLRSPKQKQTQDRLKKNHVTQHNASSLRRRTKVGIEPLRRRIYVNTGPGSSHSNQITKRSRNGRVTSYENDLTSDFFGISTQEPVVRLMDSKGPVGTATSDFVDPFNDMIEEPPLSQYAYKPQTETSDDSQMSFEGPQRPVASLQNHQTIGLNLGKMSLDEQQHTREALRATDDDTEADQAKARILTYNRLNKKKQQEKAANSSNPYAYLNLPETQSVDIEPVKTISDREEAKINSFSQHGPENRAYGHEGKENSAQEGKSSEKSVHVDITPPSEDAETVPTSVVEVKETENNNSDNNNSESQDTKAVDELTTIVSNALPDKDELTGKADDGPSVGDGDGKQQEQNKQLAEEVSSSLTKDFSKERNNKTSSVESLHDDKQSETNNSASTQKPPESTGSSNPSIEYIDIKEPNLKFSIALNGTENQTDKYIEKLENVIKLVKGMKSAAGKTSAGNNTAVIQPTPTIKQEVDNPSLNPSHTLLLDSATTTNETLANMKDSDKEKSPPPSNIGSVNATPGDYSYVMHKGNLYKVTKVSPEVEKLNTEPTERLATLDLQLSKLVMDTANKMVSKSNEDKSNAKEDNASDNIKSDRTEDDKKLIRGKFKTKQSKQGGGSKGKQKFTDGDLADKEEKAEKDEEEEDPKEETKKKHGHQRKQDYNEKIDGDDVGEDSDEEKGKGKKKHLTSVKGVIQSRRHKKKRVHGLKKTLSREDENENEEDHSVNESDLEYEDEDENETEKVPKPRGKKKKERQKLLEQDQDDAGDIDNDDKEEVDMSIHMLDKAKGFGGLKVEDSDSDGSAGGGTENDGNVQLSTEDQQPTKHKKKKKYEADKEDSKNDDEDDMVDTVKSKQKSKKLFGAALTKKSTRKKSLNSNGKQRNITFVVTQDNDDQYNVNMKTIDGHVKDDIADNDDVDEKDEMAKKVLLKNFGKPTSSVVELPSKEGGGSGYTINVFTNPDQHTKTYEIKHGEKFYRVVEKNSENSRDDRDKEKSTALVRENLPTLSLIKDQNKIEEVSSPQSTASVITYSTEGEGSSDPTIVPIPQTISKITKASPFHLESSKTLSASLGEIVPSPITAKFLLPTAPKMQSAPSGQIVPPQIAANHLPAASPANNQFTKNQDMLMSGSIRSNNPLNSPVLPPPPSILSIPKNAVIPVEQPLYQKAPINSAGGTGDHDLTVTLDTDTASSSPLKNSGSLIQQLPKTSKSALMGTRKASLPTLPTTRAFRHSAGGTSPSIGNTLLRDRNTVVTTATKSQQLSQEDFDKTLNAAIVLK